MPGFAERLKKEMKAITPSMRTIRVIDDSERDYAAWVGASILTSLSIFENMWISRRQYNEYGPSIMHGKSFS